MQCIRYVDFYSDWNFQVRDQTTGKLWRKGFNEYWFG